MRRALRRTLAATALAALLAAMGGLAALGAPVNVTYYLVGDSEPVGSLSTAMPPSISLPDYDGDSEPGLLLKKTDRGAGETDPAKYQQWSVDASGLDLSVGSVVVWAAMKDFNTSKKGSLGVYLLDCAGSCVVLDSASKSVNGKSSWSRVTVPLPADHTFASGHSLAVKVIVQDGSDDDMWLAYGTATYDAHLNTQHNVATTTTTTTSTSSTTSTSTTSTSTTSTSTTSTSTTSTSLPFPTTSTTVPSSTTTSTAPDTSSTTTTQPFPSASTSSSTTTPTIATVATGSDPTTTTLPAEGSGDIATSDDEEAVVVSPVNDRPPPGPEDVQVIETSTESNMMAVAIPESVSRLSPQQGLLVAFSTAAQTFSNHLWPALTLGLVGTVLILVGLSSRDSDLEEQTDGYQYGPGSWWFSG